MDTNADAVVTAIALPVLLYRRAKKPIESLSERTKSQNECHTTT